MKLFGAYSPAVVLLINNKRLYQWSGSIINGLLFDTIEEETSRAQENVPKGNHLDEDIFKREISSSIVSKRRPLLMMDPDY